MKEILDITKEKMGKCVNALESELATIRAGRANPSVLDRITVDYYGCPTPVNQMASISVSEARILVVQPFDASTLKSIEKAIQASDLGINPTNDGNVIRLVFPTLTEERRKEIVKQVKKMAEDAKVAVRNVRRDALDALKKMNKAKEMTDDEYADYEAKVEKKVAKAIETIEKAAAEKEKELLTV